MTRVLAEAEADKKMLSPSEVARRYVGTASLWRKLAILKVVPCYRVGSCLLAFKAEDVESYIAQHPVSGPCQLRDGRRQGKRTGRPRLVRSK